MKTENKKCPDTIVEDATDYSLNELQLTYDNLVKAGYRVNTFNLKNSTFIHAIRFKIVLFGDFNGWGN